MVAKDSAIAFVVRDANEIDLFATIFKKMGYNNIQVFDDYVKALEQALKIQFNVFLTRVDSKDMSGLVFVQKLRQSQNYGMETHFFLSDTVNEMILNVLLEYDIQYILTKPFTQDRVVQKLNFLCNSETNLTEFEKKYREAKTAFTAGMFEFSEEMAKDLLKKFGKSEKLLLLFGDIYIKMNKLVDANKFYEAAKMLNPSSAAAASKIAHIYVLEKNFEKAAEITNELAKLNPYNIRLLLDAGMSNMETGNLAKAKEHLKTVQALDKGDKKSGEIMAKVHLKEGNYKALANSLKESHSEKEQIAFLNNEGVRLSRESKPDEAIKMYINCLDHFKNNEYLHIVIYNLGLGYLKMSDTVNAKKFLQIALDKKPDFEKAAQALKTIR